MEPIIMTFSGNYFNLLYPEQNKILLEDIAHALANTCRFGGHCREFYSVSQHAVLVSHLAPKEFAWDALHHDDAEAFLGDIPTPLKQLLPEFKKIEHNLEQVIWKHYGISSVLNPAVKNADLQALMIERYSFMPLDDIAWDCFKDVTISEMMPEMIPLKALSPNDAKKLFIERHLELAHLNK
jgi:hypothetical protein